MNQRFASVCEKSVRRLLVQLLAGFLIFSACAPRACAALEREDNCPLAEDLHIPTYRWSNPDMPARVVIVALHGFLLHGGTFDRLASHLAARGAVVYAPDLRGFGRARGAWPGGSRISYRKSQQDVSKLLQYLRSKHPGAPIVCVGESMGANLAVSIAAEHPELVDGLVLSSPCIVNHRALLRTRFIRDAFVGLVCPWCQIDVASYAKKYVPAESLSDPLVRTRVGFWDVARTLRGLQATLNQASQVASRTPVLLLRGSNDQLCKYKAVAKLADHLTSSCKILDCVSNQGHLLLEIGSDLGNVDELIDKWLGNKLCANLATSGKVIEPGLKDKSIERDTFSEGRGMSVVEQKAQQ